MSMYFGYLVLKFDGSHHIAEIIKLGKDGMEHEQHDTDFPFH